MTAKHKLNSANINGALLIAAALGAATNSGAVFAIAAVVLIAQAVHTGAIRK